ncbi:amidohydrolase [Cysteiniphilum halobium]|uniref:amidohydrolase n=1 Tax=Cysteiniphilum halobium TaxID=2219059 RepID=UPI000E659B95|nr:amidohydrolase [Cysteiniphilum halobium]
MSSLKVAVIQSDIVWEDKFANYTHFEHIISTLETCDLIVLPEMFNVGFTPNMNKAITDPHEIIAWLIKQAQHKSAAIIGSVVVLNDLQKAVNRLFFVTPQAEVYHYDKYHLFVLSDEYKLLSPGKSREIVHYKGFDILLSICFDLRFPVFNCNNNDYDLLINIASWPAKRRDHWRTLLQARAIENQVYVIGCNRIGTDGLGFDYSGDSLCIHFDGEIQQDIAAYAPGVLYHSFDKNHLDDYRKSFKVLASQDKFSLNLAAN